MHMNLTSGFHHHPCVKTYPSSGVQSCLYQTYAFSVTENEHLKINYLGLSSLSENKTSKV